MEADSADFPWCLAAPGPPLEGGRWECQASISAGKITTAMPCEIGSGRYARSTLSRPRLRGHPKPCTAGSYPGRRVSQPRDVGAGRSARQRRWPPAQD